MRDVVIIAIFLDEAWKGQIIRVFPVFPDMIETAIPAYLYTSYRRNVLDVQTTPYRNMFGSAMLASFSCSSS